jgi:hypothetical protein
MVTRTMGELSELSRVSPVPVVVGGGVKTRDLAALKQDRRGWLLCHFRRCRSAGPRKGS